MGALLLVVTVMAWVVVVNQAMTMQGMSAGATDTAGAQMSIPNGEMDMASDEMSRSGDMGMSMMMPDVLPALSFSGAGPYLIAWGVMMTAMMLPSAAPMMILYRGIRRKSSETTQKGISTAAFVLVYLLVWLAFGVPIFVASTLIDFLARTDPTVEQLLSYGVALVLIVAGLYQLTPLKRACLRVCQSPLGFLLGRWQSGYRGTLKLALDHALYCVGCCWALMVVLVAAGAMALHWVLLIAAVVFAEKVLPGGEWVARVTGVALIVLAVLVAAQPQLVTLLQGPS